MNLNLTGHHLVLTPAIRDYVTVKLERVTRHFDHVIDVNVVLSVDKLEQQITANLHVRGKEIHAECADPDMYAAIDALAEANSISQVLRHKEKLNGHRHEPAANKHSADGSEPGDVGTQ